ncbi:MAG: bifunctional adenosylcobinamide kinase/adenosylcobinamide-phosphate guanylyltransferase [Hydrogenophilus sp.]|nr:bifunctional adenosylcobinamide kinase/adenosylcobinamide-phosphate guanylyltransferase [Hydrogenophilus sp.]
MIELILGGARSGKSAFAVRRAQESSLEVIYIATAQALDPEMAARITRHRAERPTFWRTIEEPLFLADLLHRTAAPTVCLLIDCLTLWLSNLLLARQETEIERLLNLLPTLTGHLIFVSNEVGLGTVPDHPLARRFRDEQGRLNQQIALHAQRVTWMVAGLPITLKEEPAGPKDKSAPCQPKPLYP